MLCLTPQAVLALSLGPWFHQSYCIHGLPFYNFPMKAKYDSKKENTVHP